MSYFFTKIKFSGSTNYFNIGNSDDGIKVKEIVKILLKKKNPERHQFTREQNMDGKEMFHFINIPQKN